MELPANPFKRALHAGRLQVGLWSSLASHLSVEILAGSGLDWLLLDCEHAPNEVPMVHTQLLATLGGTAHPIVRPPWNDAVLIKRLLDVGAQSFLIPYVERLAQRSIDLGCLFVAVGSDVGLLVKGSEQLAARSKARP